MMKPLVNEDAFSEVIGFVLILGVIALGLSLYTYTWSPVWQGRGCPIKTSRSPQES